MPRMIFPNLAVADVERAKQLFRRSAVDAMVKTALAHGGQSAMPPQDHGFMYQHSFLDPDGHQWEPFYMDPSHVQPVS